MSLFTALYDNSLIIEAQSVPLLLVVHVKHEEETYEWRHNIGNT